MRRGFSIFLIVLFGLGPLSVMIAGSSDAALPACCRRHGEHHCAAQMAAMMRSVDPQPSFTAPATCPNYPGPTLAILIPVHALASAAGCAYIAAMRTPVPDLARAAAYSTPGRTHAGRGPPATNLG